MNHLEHPVIDAILKRRSIRRYSGKPVNKSVTELLLKAGMYAPSARNQQPWHFIVITENIAQQDLGYPLEPMVKDKH